jgi:hypothetical protein
VIASFLEESAVTAVAAEDVENPEAQFHTVEGQTLPPIEAVETVRAMLREEGWCLLRDGDRFYIHVGWDYYLYVGSNCSCRRSVDLAGQLGLFIDEPFASPYLERGSGELLREHS